METNMFAWKTNWARSVPSALFAIACAACLLMQPRVVQAGKGGVPGPGSNRFDPAGDRPPGGNLCIAPWAVNLCAVLGVSEAFPFRGDAVSAGDFWIPVTQWFTNTPDPGLPGIPLTYPVGYAPAFPTDPLRDFRSKLVSVRVVVDPGTSQERNYIYVDPLNITRAVTCGAFFGTGGCDPIDDAPGAIPIPKINPRSVGSHRVKVFWTLSADHWDGLGVDPDENFLPAGEFCVRGCGGLFVFSFVPHNP
jgi:hypothetical protein